MIGWAAVVWAQGLENPDDCCPKPRADLGQVLERSHEIERLEGLLAGPDGNRAAVLWLALAEAYAASSDSEAALAASQSAVAVATGSVRLDALEALARRQKGAQAVATWKRAIAQPSTAERRAGLLSELVHAAANDPVNLGPYLRSGAPASVRGDPTLAAGAWCALGAAYARRGRGPEALDAFRAGVAVAPGTEVAVLCALGWLGPLSEDPRFDAAVDAVFAAFPGPYTSTERTALASHLVQVVSLAVQQGRVEVARRWAETWLARFPEHYRAAEVTALVARLLAE